MPLGFPTRIAMGIAWCALGRMTSAQLPGLAVDPRVVILSAQQPGGRVTVFNPRLTAVEMTTSMRYGLITADSTGYPTVRLGDRRDSASTNAAGWITPYPERFILNPGASQAVRLYAKPPQSLADGEYWARLIIQARELAPPLKATVLPIQNDSASGIHLGLSIETSTILPVFYRTGRVITNVTVDTLITTRHGDSLTIHPTLRRSGNAAYLGVANVAITDSLGGTLLSFQKRVAIYQAISPTWTVTLPPTTRPGTYHLTLSLSTNRPDAPPNTVIRAPITNRTFTIAIP